MSGHKKPGPHPTSMANFLRHVHRIFSIFPNSLESQKNSRGWNWTQAIGHILSWYIQIVQGGAPGRNCVQLVNMLVLFHIFHVWVDEWGLYRTSYWDYKPTNITGGAPPCIR